MNQLKQGQQVVVLAVCLIALVLSASAQKLDKLDAEEEIEEEAAFKKPVLQGAIGHQGKGVHHAGHAGQAGHAGHLNHVNHAGHVGHLGQAGLSGGQPGLNGLASNIGNFGNFGNQLTDFISKAAGGKSASAPLNSARLEGSASAGSGAVIGAAPSAVAAAVAHEEKHHQHCLGHEFHKFFELLLKPLELLKAIAEHFMLPFKAFVDLVLKGMVFGVEVAFSPLLVTFRIIEKVFVPDACRLRLMCQIGLHLKALKETVLLYTPHFLETSAHIKALSDGIVGRDCEATFIACEPKLKKPFEELKAHAHGHARGLDPELPVPSLAPEASASSPAN